MLNAALEQAVFDPWCVVAVESGPAVLVVIGKPFEKRRCRFKHMVCPVMMREVYHNMHCLRKSRKIRRLAYELVVSVVAFFHGGEILNELPCKTAFSPVGTEIAKYETWQPFVNLRSWPCVRHSSFNLTGLGKI